MCVSPVFTLVDKWEPICVYLSLDLHPPSSNSLSNTGMSADAPELPATEEMLVMGKEKLVKVVNRLQTRFIMTPKHPLKVKHHDTGSTLIICAKGRDIPELSMNISVVPMGMVMTLDVPPSPSGVSDTLLAFCDKLKNSFPNEENFPQVQLVVDSGAVYEFTVFSQPAPGLDLWRWEYVHARRLVEAAMLACWSHVEALNPILYAGLFQKMPAIPCPKQEWIPNSRKAPVNLPSDSRSYMVTG